jgi:predicted PurR-regulated permease PerM
MDVVPSGNGHGEPAPAAQTRRARVRQAAEAHGVPLATILTAVAVVVVTYLAGKLIYRLRDIVLIVGVAAFIALLLDPPVLFLQRRWIRRRGLAVAVVAIWAVLVFIGLLFAFGYPLVNGISHFAHQLPSYVSAAEHGNGWIGHLVRRFHLQAWVTANAPKLQTLGQNLAKPALTVGRGAVSLLATLGTIAALAVLFLLEAPRMRAAVVGLMPPQRTERYQRVAADINRSISGYAFGNLLTSLIAGLVVLVTLAVLGVPFPLLWAVWVALVDFLPMIGGALAGIPTVIFALGHSLLAGLVTAAVFLAYTQLENHVLNPVVIGRTARVSPLLVLLSVLVGTSIGAWLGGAFGAFVAALVSVPLAGALQIVIRELWKATAWQQDERHGDAPPEPRC